MCNQLKRVENWEPKYIINFICAIIIMIVLETKSEGPHN